MLEKKKFCAAPRPYREMRISISMGRNKYIYISRRAEKITMYFFSLIRGMIYDGVNNE